MEKTERFELRMTQREKKKLMKKAAEADQPLSRYLVDMGLNGKVINYDYLMALHVQMCRIGNNINQAVKIMNTFYADCEDEFTFVYDQLMELKQVIDKYLDREIEENF